MKGGNLHEPSVFTHFLPGILSGFVFGGIAGTLIITHIAVGSLQFFWQSIRQEKEVDTSCADISGLHATSEMSEAGTQFTSIVVGDGEVTSLTVPQEHIRYVPSTDSTEAYLTAVALADQQAAFPATSLYRVDYCAKTLTHILGSSEDSLLLGVSAAGSWVLFQDADGLKLMQTDDHRVLSAQVTSSAPLVEFLFSPREDAIAVRYADSLVVVWNTGLHGTSVTEEAGLLSTSLPAWDFQSVDEYSAMFE